VERPGAPPETLPPPRAGYDGVSGYGPDLDTKPLADRRIVLDPGHGGRWAGTRGAAGTREADVNLRVGLALCDLLRRAGAQVWLTRESDTDRASPADSSLVFDLKARAAYADSLEAEVFLSLHHNADAGGRSDVNETQTYFRRGDEGPSLDLAQALHRRFVQALRIAPARLVAGNYSVLRNTHADAACLLEPSYLTFPGTESLLVDSSAVRLEAEAYFMGLLDYFRRGTPRVESVAWDRAWTGPDAWRPVAARLSEEPLAVEAWLDGEPLAGSGLARRSAPSGGVDVLLPPATPWRDGKRAFAFRLRGQGGNHSPLRAETVAVELTAARLRLEALPAEAASGPVALTVTALDAWDRPLADTLFHRDLTWLPSPPPALVDSAGIVGLEEEGKARLYAGPNRPRNASWRVLWRGLGSNPVSVAKGAAGPWRTGRVRWEGGGGRIRGATVRDPRSGAASACDEAGFFALRADSPGPLEASAPGFHFLGPDSSGAPRLAPHAGGALLGRRVAVDAIGGGEAPDGVAPDGSAGSPINLRVAQLLADYLERAGAVVERVRLREGTLSDAERVDRIERFAAERVVRVGRRSGGPSAVGFFPGSAGGDRLARAVLHRVAAGEASYAEALGDSVRAAAIRWEDASWVLQQTSCPSVSVRFGDFADSTGAGRFSDPAWQMREAYWIFAALAEDFGAPADSERRADPLVAADLSLGSEAGPLAGVLVALDGMALLTDARGRARFERLDPALPHRSTVHWPGSPEPASAWIDLARSRAWTWERRQSAPAPAGRPR
jgi:N-acetylmuramoyl-L-alanine amidase